MAVSAMVGIGEALRARYAAIRGEGASEIFV